MGRIVVSKVNHGLYNTYSICCVVTFPLRIMSGFSPYPIYFDTN